MATCTPTTNIPAPPKKEPVLSYFGGLFEVRQREVTCWRAIEAGYDPTKIVWMKPYGYCNGIDFGRKPDGRWKKSVPADPNSKLFRKLAGYYAQWSGKEWARQLRYPRPSPPTPAGKLNGKLSWKMSRLLADPDFKKEWVVDFGELHAPIRPKPDETLAQFQARKGYLLWVGPNSVMTGDTPIGRVEVESQDDYILYATYLPAEKSIRFSIKVERAGMLEIMGESAKNLPGQLFDLGKILFKLICRVLTKDELTQIVATANAAPGAVPPQVQAGAQAFMAGSALCNYLWPKCVAPGLPPEVLPPATPWWDSPWVKYGAVGAAVLVAGAVVVKSRRAAPAK